MSWRMVATMLAFFATACGPPATAVVLDGSDDREPPAAAPSESGQALFYGSYMNWAWGYQARGCVLYASGGIYAWDDNEPADHVGWHENSEKTWVASVDAAEVARMAELIAPAALGSISERRTAADAGGTWYRAALRTDGEENPVDVTLLVTGDRTRVNQSDAAMALVSWLREVFPDECPEPW